MNINCAVKANKYFIPELKTCSHGVVRIIRQNLADEFLLSEEKLRNPMPCFDFFLKKRNPHPTNLTNELKRIKYTGSEVEKLLKNNPNLSRTIGSLPQKWGRKIGNEPLLREGIDKTFSDFAEKFYKGYISHKDIDFMQVKLSVLLGTDVKVSSLGQGYYGKTFKINSDSQNYVLKVFYKNNYDVEDIAHGNFSELASAIFANKHEADKFATFYMGKFGKNNDGYILTKYIAETSPKHRIINDLNEKSENNFSFTRFMRKVETNDNACGNKLGTKVVDFGGMVVNSSINLEPKVYILAKMISKCLDTNNAKELENIIKRNQKHPEFKQAVGFIQDLINTKCTSKNYRILEQKKDMLERLGLDYIPDIRYVLSGNRRFISDIINNTGLNIMYGLSYKTFVNLWEKYNEILKNLKIH